MACPAIAEPPRLAIVDESSSSELSSSLTVELSLNPAVALVERDEMKKIAREKEFQSMLGRHDFGAIGRLVKADGLIILQRTRSDKAEWILVRLVAVNPGVVIDTLALPAEESQSVPQARRVAECFSSLFSKLQDSDAGQSQRLSLLGLRCELESAAGKVCERTLNSLLAARLSHYSHLLVLERWQLDGAAWEKSLEVTPQNPFWTGSALVDGHIREKGNVLDVKVRLRRSESDPGRLVECSGNASDLMGLADRVAAKIALSFEVTEPPLAWNAVTEGANYRHHAEWAYKHALYDDALVACRTARALNPGDVAASELLIRTWNRKACNENEIDVREFKLSSFKPELMSSYVDAATEALRVVKDHSARFDVKPDWNRPESEAIAAALKVLRAAYDHKYHINHVESLKQLRELTRGIIALLGTVDTDPNPKLVHVKREEYLAYWCETPEETLRQYRLCFDRNWKFNPKYNFGAVNLIAWKPEDAARLPKLWRGFVEKLTSSSDVYEQAIGYHIQYNDCELPAYAGAFEPPFDKRAAYSQLSEFLWNNRDAIVDGRLDIYQFTLIFGSELLHGNYRETQASQSRLLVYLLKKSSSLNLTPFKPLFSISAYSHSTHQESTKAFQPTQAAELLAALGDYEKRMTGDPQFKTRILPDIVSMKHTCELELTAPAAPKSEPLKITRFWSPQSIALNPSSTSRGYGEFDRRGLAYFDGRLWFAYGFSGPAGSIDLNTFQTESLPPASLPEGMSPEICRSVGGVVVTKDYFFRIGTIVQKYDRTTRLWSTLDLPPSTYGGALIDGSLYLSFDRSSWKKAPGLTHGLLKIDPLTNETEIVLSNRRIPAVNRLESQMKEPPLGLFMGPGNRLHLYFGFLPNAIYKQDSSGVEWEALTPRRVSSEDVSITEDGAILHSLPNDKDQKVYWFGRSLPKAELLLASSPLRGDDGQEARWKFPESLRAVEVDEKCWTLMVMDQGNLWVLARNISSSATAGRNSRLYFFGRNKNEAVEIPIELEYPAEVKARYSKQSWAALEIDSNVTGPLLMTPEGLVVPSKMVPGFWLISRATIDGYIKDTGKATKP